MAKKQKRIELIKQARGGYKDRAGNSYTDKAGVQLLLEGKAVTATWKGGKKGKQKSYEGMQYAGGRKPGRKNLKKTEAGNLLNEHGVEFTPAERKALESAVNRANRKRMKMIQEEGSLPRLVNGQPTGESVSQLQLMGKQSDFIISRKSKSLQQFKSKEDYERYMKNLEYVNSPTYIDDRLRLYKRNHMRALKNVFGEDAKDVVMKIRMMKAIGSVHSTSAAVLATPFPPLKPKKMGNTCPMIENSPAMYIPASAASSAPMPTAIAVLSISPISRS